MFAILEHPADVGFSFEAPTREEAFREAARALTYLLVGDAPLGAGQERPLRVTGESAEELLYNFLSELVYLFDAEHFLAGDVRFRLLDERELEATAVGETYARQRHGAVQNYVKAVTYHQLRLAPRDGSFAGAVFVDI